MAEAGGRSASRKFDPAKAGRLDAPERERYLPDASLVALLGLRGGETVVDYGAGTGRLAIAVSRALGDGGRVLAVEENERMATHLRGRVAEARARVEVLPIAGNHVPTSDAGVDRVLAVNLLHEVHGESALEEMRRPWVRMGCCWSPIGSAGAIPSEPWGLRMRSSTPKAKPSLSSSRPVSQWSAAKASSTTSRCSPAHGVEALRRRRRENAWASVGVETI